jgi:integrase
VNPQHYLFPFCITRKKKGERYDPERPMTSSGLKSPWQEVREATNLLWFRPYDTRHTGATRYAENGTPVDVIVARMGHANDRQRALYTHISLEAQRRLARNTPAAGYGPKREWSPAGRQFSNR